MHILGIRDRVDSFSSTRSLLDTILPLATEPRKSDYFTKSRGLVQSLLPCRLFACGSTYDSIASYGFTDCSYSHFRHCRFDPIRFRRNKPPHDILIIGATGLIGTYITKAILDAHSQGHFGRICIYTSERTVVEKVQDICALESCGVEVWMGSLDDEHRFKEACRDIDTIVSCVGREVISKQVDLITWAEACHVTRFLPSEFGTDIEYFPNSLHEPPHQMKLKVRAHMTSMQRIEHTYLVTGPCSDLYLGTMNEKPEAGGFDVKQRQAHLLGDGDGLVSFTAMDDIGKFVVAALINYNISRNSTLIVHSFTAKPKDILAEYEAQTGSNWDVKYTSLQDLKVMEKQAYRKYCPLATSLTLRRIWTEGGTLYKYYDDTLLGHVETQTLQSQVTLSIKRQMTCAPAEELLLEGLSGV